MLKLFVEKAQSLWKDDQGADLIEYGLLATIIAVAGVALFPTIYSKLGSAFGTWGGQVYNAWIPNDPQP
jgi:Flp pilus assembly pilin Flp